MYGDEENDDLRVDEREAEPKVSEDDRLDERLEETPPTPVDPPESDD